MADKFQTIITALKFGGYSYDNAEEVQNYVQNEYGIDLTLNEAAHILDAVSGWSS